MLDYPASDASTMNTGGSRERWHESLKNLWRRGPVVCRFLYVSGIMLLSSAVAHIFVWAVVGGSAIGPLSWRKPILFGIATGLTVLSIGWVLSLFTNGRGMVGLGALFGVAALVEVALISMQTWRGVPSHFNGATPFDAAVSVTIDVCALLLTVVIAVVAFRCFEKLTAEGRALAPDLILSIRAGMAFLLLSCFVGVGMAAYGRLALSQGRVPSLIEPLTLLHGASIHAVQWLPALARALAARGVEPRQRHRLVLLALAATACLTAWAGVPILAAHGLAITTVSGVLLTAALAGFLVPVLWFGRRGRVVAGRL
jgi:hypothetical protein